MTQQDLEQLLAVNVALTAERDKEKFLSMVLDAAIAAARCDGGTLYLLENGALRFARMTTLSLGIRRGGHDGPIALPPVPMEPQYVCAWAAIHRKPVSIPDVRKAEAYDFSGTEKYDRMTGYRTESMLVIPMTGDKGEMIGVLQLINALDGERVVPFSAEIGQPVSALASQAAACIQNMRYAEQVNALLDSLVNAMTAAIDDRASYNARHSGNMALCAECFLDRAGAKDPAWNWTADHRRAFLLSVRLHDVGKLVTPLDVMNKRDRLGEKLARIEERFRRMGLLDRIALLEGRITEEQCRNQAETRRETLDRIRRMNTAEVLSPEEVQWAEALACRTVPDENGAGEALLTQEEAECLRIRRGTLTPGERQIMENHVKETSRILDQVCFPPEYRQIPFWAASHHEYLDGSGYPDHLTAEQIPAEVRLMTILDIFDSLVASDRPYKKPMAPAGALGILKQMEAQGKLDGGLLELFEESRAWEAVYG